MRFFFSVLGVLEWTDFTQVFCEFTRPDDSVAVRATNLNVENVLLLTQNFVTIRVQILTCFYGAQDVLSNNNDDPPTVQVSYGQGPDGKHYEMRRAPIFEALDSFAIYGEVTAPPRIEKLFHDHFLGTPAHTIFLPFIFAVARI